MSKKTIISLTALSILLLFSLLGIYQRIISKYTCALNDTSGAVEFSFRQKKGKGDKWYTIFPEFGREYANCYGVIYEATLENHSTRQIDSWTLRVDITQDCFLNSAWNGGIEVHQFINGKEKIQKSTDLRTIDPNNLTCENKMNNRGFVMIHLTPGDYIIYHPSSLDVPIAGFKNRANYAYTTFGFIFYTVSGAPLVNFNEGTIKYHLKNGYLEDSSFYVFILIAVTVIFSIFTIIRTHKVKTHRQMNLDHDREMIEQITKVFTKFIDAKDPYTGGHSERVANIARMIAEEMGMGKARAQILYYCGLLHDCGKISISDSILTKPEKLTPEEYKLIQDHTIKGNELLQELTTIPEAAEAARCHHERYDGSGYPYGLKGEDIPLYARIITVADSFDTMNTDRYYRKALAKNVIISQIEECKGTQFDPEIANAFLSLINKGKIEFHQIM